jgi:hypothetical protein
MQLSDSINMLCDSQSHGGLILYHQSWPMAGGLAVSLCSRLDATFDVCDGNLQLTTLEI